MSKDLIVEEVRRVRDQLVKKYGGLDGWIRHLQAMDRKCTRNSRRHTDGKREVGVSSSRDISNK